MQIRAAAFPSADKMRDTTRHTDPLANTCRVIQ